MNEFLTWDVLTSYAGATLAVTIITNFIKDLGFIKRIPTRITAYFVAIIVMIAATCFTGTFTWPAFALVFINAIVVALAANGTYDFCNAAFNTHVDEGYTED